MDEQKNNNENIHSVSDQITEGAPSIDTHPQPQAPEQVVDFAVNNSVNGNKFSFTTASLLVVGIACVVIGGIVYWWYISSQPTESEFLDIKHVSLNDLQKPFEQEVLRTQAEEKRNEGQFAESAALYEEAAEKTGNSVEQADSVARAGVSNFLTGEEEKQIKAVQQLKTVILSSEEASGVRAHAIVDLASLICGSGCNQLLFDEIKSDPMFSVYVSSNDISEGVRQLYEWSIQVRPLPEAYVRAGAWYADQLLLHRNSLSFTTLNNYRDALEAHLTAAGEFTDDEISSSRRALTSFYFWHGFGYGALTALDSSYAPLFEEAYAKSRSLGEVASLDSAANMAVAFTYYQYAALLSHIYGNVRITDIQANLDKLMSDIRASNNTNSNQFLLMVSNELESEGLQHGFVGASISTLANLYPSFNTFLTEFGHSL